MPESFPNIVAGRFLFLVMIILVFTGCGLLSPASDDSDRDAHIVFLTHEDCRYVVVKTQGGRFGVLIPEDESTLQQGDMLVGALRPGRVMLTRMIFPSQQLASTTSYRALEHDARLSTVQATWREACGFVEAGS